MKKGTIIKIISNQYDVLSEAGDRISCVAMGKLRKSRSPVVGDHVWWETIGDKNGIQKIMPRRNELKRPLIANVDQAIIVMSSVDPDFSSTLIDRLIFQICYAGIQPRLCVTKCDLIGSDHVVWKQIEDYRSSGYEVYVSGIGYDDHDLILALKDKISVLTGQSGAGKSSLLNRIEPSFHLQTQEISKALGRGKHTTRHCELWKVKEGWVADTPGFSSLDFSTMDMQKLAECIPDFKPYQGQCKFRDCIHRNEPDCAVSQAVDEKRIVKSRYMHYLDILDMIEQTKTKYR